MKRLLVVLAVCVGLIGVAIVGMAILIWIFPPSAEDVAAARERLQSERRQPKPERKPPEPEISPLTFAEVDGRFGVNGVLTEVQKRERWADYEGKCVEWTGTLEHADRKIMGGFSLGFRHRPDTLTYDVLLDAGREDRDEVMAMRQGGIYRYRARLSDYGGALIPISGEYGCR